MTLFLVRDDDANATTDPDRLARCYAPLLDAGLPLAFSVIPSVALDTRAPDGSRERFVDEDVPESHHEVPLTERAPIARWLRAHAAQVDVLQHGYSHGRVRQGTEFGALREGAAALRIEDGRRQLRAALWKDPAGFVAPWDALSRGALAAATRAFPLVSTGWLDIPRLPPSAWPGHVLERLRRREALRVGQAWVLRHRGGALDASTRPERVPAILDRLARGAAVAVVVLHHWMYWGSREPHPAVRALAEELRRRQVRGVQGLLASLGGGP